MFLVLTTFISAYRYDFDWEESQALIPASQWYVNGAGTWVSSPAFGNYSLTHLGFYFTWAFDYGRYGYDDIIYIDFKTNITALSSSRFGAIGGGGVTSYTNFDVSTPRNEWLNYSYKINSSSGFIERWVNGAYFNQTIPTGMQSLWFGGGGLSSNPLIFYLDDFYIYNLKPIVDIEWSGSPANLSTYKNVETIDFGYDINPFYYNRLNETDCVLYVNGTQQDISYNNPVGTHSLTYDVGENEKSSFDYEIICTGIDNEGLEGVDTTYFKTINICNENWVLNLSNCMTNDTLIAEYYDSNECGTSYNVPEDTGSIMSCNYCLIDYSEINGDCDGLLRTVYYEINNYETCCGLTGIEDDCGVPSNYTEPCTKVGVHQTSDITGLVIDTGVELGRNYLLYVGLIALLTLYLIFKYLKKNNYF